MEQQQSLKDVYGNLTAGDNWTAWNKYGGDTMMSRVHTRDKLGFEQIARTEQQIEHIKERLESRKVSRHKKLKARCKLEFLEEHLVKLQRCHDEVARKLKVRVMTMAILPREMRDAIFQQLYVRNTAFEVLLSRVGSHPVYNMPKDEALYLSQKHVGPEVAGEAADVFYKYTLFAFSTVHARNWSTWSSQPVATMGWTKDIFEKWLDSDHYGSGTVPRDLVRKISLIMRDPSGYGFDSTQTIYSPSLTPQICDHLTFEASYTKFKDNDSYSHLRNQWDHRAQLEYLLTLDSLHEVHLTAPVQEGYVDQLLRLFNPYIRLLKEKNVKVFVECNLPTGKCEDISALFDIPSPQDETIFEKVFKRPHRHINDKEADMAIWWALSKEGSRESYNIDTVESGLIRVILQEHYEVFKFYQKHRGWLEELNRIRDEVEGQNEATRRIRRDNYARVVDLMSTSPF